MSENVLERLSDESGLMVSDFHDSKNYRIMYDFLRNLPRDAYSLKELSVAVGYALYENSVEFESIDELLEYLYSRL